MRVIWLVLGLAQAVGVPVGQRAVVTATGVGVQIYKCDATGKWTFVGPEAKLLVGGQAVGTHGAGPVWVYGDGSAVKGKVVSTVASPDAGAVPWLGLTAESTGGAGVLASVGFVTRTDTVGGVAPEMGCGVDTVGQVRRVPYSATYTFYAAGMR